MKVRLLTNLGLHGAKPAIDEVLAIAGRFELRGKRSHRLWILSCYVNPAAVEELATRLAMVVRLTNVFLAFDYGELIAQGASTLETSLKQLQRRLRRKKIDLEWRPLRPKSGGLVHAKGISVVQTDPQLRMTEGLLLAGSANATRPGLGLSDRSNVELGLLTQRESDILQFNDVFTQLWDNECVDPSAQIERHQHELHRFSVLASGKFLTKWGGNLRSQLSLRFGLTEEGKRLYRTADAELREMDLVLAADSVTKLYLTIPEELKERDFPGSFSRDYTIETSIGRWCPGSVWRVVEHALKHDDGAFLAALEAALSDDALEVAGRLAEADIERLEARRIIAVDDHLVRDWKDRMRELRRNPGRLVRIRRTFSDFDLPYGREDTDEIRAVYESLLDSVRSARRLNRAAQLVREMDRVGTGAGAELDSDEVRELRLLFA